jgi:hypothetical protein
MTRNPHAIVSFVLLSFLLAISGVAAQRAVERPAQLTGTVVADDTGLPIASANVRVGDRAARTDEQGRFEVGGLPAGSYLVTATFTGYATTAPGQQRPQDPRVPVELPQGGVRIVEVRLIPLGVLTGRIFDENGSASARVSVRAVRQAPLRTINTRGVTALTDNDGRFTLRGLQTGRYYVIAETREGKIESPGPAGLTLVGDGSAMTSYYPGTSFPDQARTIEIDAGTTVDATFALTRTRLTRVTGRVVDSTGQTPGDFMVLPISRPPQPSPPGSMSLKTDGKGRFELTGVPPGEYSIDVLTRATFLKPDGTPSERSVDDGPVGEFASHRFRVTGDDIEELVLHTEAGFSITGRIGGASSRFDHQGANATAEPPVDRLSAAISPRRAAVGRDGRFEIKGVRGPYVLRFASLPPGMMVTEILSDGVDVIDSGIDVMKNTELEVVLERQSELAGRVTDARGRAVTSAVVFVSTETDDLDVLVSGATRLQIRAGTTSSVSVRVD